MLNAVAHRATVKNAFMTLGVGLARGRELLYRPPDIPAKALATHSIWAAGAGIAALAVALLLEASADWAALLLLASIGLALGWLSNRRVWAPISIATAVGLAVEGLAGPFPWGSAISQAAVFFLVAGLADLAAIGKLARTSQTDAQADLRVLNALLQAGEALAALLDKNVILKTAVDAAAAAVSRPGKDRPAHSAFHAIRGEEASITEVADDPDGRRLASGLQYSISPNTAVGAALRTGHSTIVRPYNLSWPLRDLAERLDLRVMIVAAVYCGRTAEGLLVATSRRDLAVNQRQKRTLETLARLTSLSLTRAAELEFLRLANRKNEATARSGDDLLTGPVEELRAAIDVLRGQIREQDPRRSGAGLLVAGLDRLEEVVSTLASRTAFEVSTGLPNRTLGISMLERDVLRAHRTLLGRHCLVVLRLASAPPNQEADLQRTVVERLRMRLRREDLLFHYSPQELVCSFADMDITDAEPILVAIRNELAAELGYTPFGMGWAGLQLGQSATQLLNRAQARRTPVPQRVTSLPGDRA